jgi:hypothetical protein
MRAISSSAAAIIINTFESSLMREFLLGSGAPDGGAVRPGRPTLSGMEQQAMPSLLSVRARSHDRRVFRLAEGANIPGR